MAYINKEKEAAFSWEKMMVDQWQKYFLVKMEMNSLPRTPEKIAQAYSCLQDLELLAQVKIQQSSQEAKANYKINRISENEIKTLESNGDFLDCTNKLHRWALSLEPFFRRIQPVEKTSIEIGDIEESIDSNEEGV